jgi:hypothetical protein
MSAATTSIDSTTTTDIRISWVQPTTNGGSILSYQVFIINSAGTAI